MSQEESSTLIQITIRGDDNKEITLQVDPANLLGSFEGQLAVLGISHFEEEQKLEATFLLNNQLTHPISLTARSANNNQSEALVQSLGPPDDGAKVYFYQFTSNHSDGRILELSEDEIHALCNIMEKELIIEMKWYKSGLWLNNSAEFHRKLHHIFVVLQTAAKTYYSIEKTKKGVSIQKSENERDVHLKRTGSKGVKERLHIYETALTFRNIQNVPVSRILKNIFLNETKYNFLLNNCQIFAQKLQFAIEVAQLALNPNLS